MIGPVDWGVFFWPSGQRFDFCKQKERCKSRGDLVVNYVKCGEELCVSTGHICCGVTCQERFGLKHVIPTPNADPFAISD